MGVTPFAGVWIEIVRSLRNPSPSKVTPFAGVWIEICLDRFFDRVGKESLPSRECGLKSLSALRD